MSEVFPPIPANWAMASVSDLGAISGGGTPNTADQRYWAGGAIPWVSPKDMKTLEIGDAQDHITDTALQETSARLMPSGTVLVVIRSGILQHTLPVGIATRDVVLNQDMKGIILAKGFVPRYIAYALKASESHILHDCCKAGTTVQSVQMPQFLRLQLPIAPSVEQRRIVAKIDELFSDLDAGVAALQRVKANLKRYRASVLKAAVEGRLTAKWRADHPSAEPASKLLQRILTERRKKWEADQLAKFKAAGKTPPTTWQAKYEGPAAPDTSNLPELPKGWCWATAEQLGNVQLGRQRSPKNRSKDYPTKYIRAANITEAGLNMEDILEMEFQPHELQTYRMMPGDLVLSEASGSPDQVGKPAVWGGQIPDCCFQNTVIRLRPWGVRSNYLLVVFQSFYTSKVFARVAAGVGINHLSAAKFSRLPIPLAPLDEQGIIAGEVDRCMSVIAAAGTTINTTSARASRLRQSILKRAFEGKLVPQDPTEEPAAKLLDRIHAARPLNPKPTKRPKTKRQEVEA